MNSSATLFGEIFEITRGDLDNACFPYIKPVEYLRSTVPIRLTRLSQFWKQAGSNEAAILHQSVEDFVAGLFGQSCPWLFFPERSTNGDSVLVRIGPQRSGQRLLGIPSAW